MPFNAILLDEGAQHDIVLFQDVLSTVHYVVLEHNSSSLLHFSYDLFAPSIEFDLLVQDVFEVFLVAVTISRFLSLLVRRRNQDFFSVEIRVAPANVEQDLC